MELTTAAGERIQIDGTQNLRDLGGYEGADGRTVKHGLLFRSDHLHKLTSQGITQIKALDIRTIIDLRSPPEIAATPNAVIDGAQTVMLNPAAETAELSASFQAKGEDEDRILVEQLAAQPLLCNPKDGIITQYRNFVNCQESVAAFGGMMQLVAKTEHAPFLFHCRGGKDRTGYAALLILGALGAGEETIVADYMKTRTNRLARTEEKMASYARYTSRRDVLDYLRSLLEASPEYLQASLEEIQKTSGSLMNYLREKLCLSQEQISQMRDFYLESRKPS